LAHAAATGTGHHGSALAGHKPELELGGKMATAFK